MQNVYNLVPTGMECGSIYILNITGNMNKSNYFQSERHCTIIFSNHLILYLMEADSGTHLEMLPGLLVDLSSTGRES